MPGILEWLQRSGSRANIDGMGRYGIRSPRMFGVSVTALRRRAKEIGRDHDLALRLWDTGWHEARMLASFIADPALVTPALMNRWTRDFDNWAITDTVCFSLFDRSRHAWSRVDAWTRRKPEFVRRAGFALLASLALHDRNATDEEFSRRLPLIVRHASDDRNLVKKAVSWALHAIGCRSRALHEAALRTATVLAASAHPTERWVGRDALRKLKSAATAKRVNRRSEPRIRPPLNRRGPPIVI